MTDKCRKKMNGGEGYMTREISQRKGAKKRERAPGKGERPPGCEKN